MASSSSRAGAATTTVNESETKREDHEATAEDDDDHIDERTPINRRTPTAATNGHTTASSSSSSNNGYANGQVVVPIATNSSSSSSGASSLPSPSPDTQQQQQRASRFRFRLPREFLSQDAAVQALLRFFVGTVCVLVLLELALALSWLFITFWSWHLWSEYRSLSCVGNFHWWLLVIGILHCAELVHFSLKTFIQRGQQWANGEERRCNCIFLESVLIMGHFTMIILGAVWIYQTGQTDVTCVEASPLFKFVWYYITTIIAILSVLCCCTVCITVRILTDSSLLPSSTNVDQNRVRQRSDFAPLDT